MSGALFLGWRYLAHHRFKSGILIASITLMLFLPAATRLLVEDSATALTARASQTPLVLGARGSELELVLNTLYFHVESPAEIENRAFSEVQATGFAEAYVRTGAPVHARCLVALLSFWAERRALLAFDYHGNHGQAWYAIQWSAAAAGLAYSIVRSEPSLSDRRKQAVEDWLVAVASKQIGYPGNELS